LEYCTVSGVKAPQFCWRELRLGQLAVLAAAGGDDDVQRVIERRGQRIPAPALAGVDQIDRAGLDDIALRRHHCVHLGWVERRGSAQRR
jgi:hypothetical protein